MVWQACSAVVGIMGATSLSLRDAVAKKVRRSIMASLNRSADADHRRWYRIIVFITTSTDPFLNLRQVQFPIDMSLPWLLIQHAVIPQPFSNPGTSGGGGLGSGRASVGSLAFSRLSLSDTPSEGDPSSVQVKVR